MAVPSLLIPAGALAVEHSRDKIGTRQISVVRRSNILRNDVPLVGLCSSVFADGRWPSANNCKMHRILVLSHPKISGTLMPRRCPSLLGQVPVVGSKELFDRIIDLRLTTSEHLLLDFGHHIKFP